MQVEEAGRAESVSRRKAGLRITGEMVVELKNEQMDRMSDRRTRHTTKGTRMTKHYALTDQKEFFAEMSESFFGMNDFFPFNRAELKQEEPALFELLCEIWGRVPPT